MASLLGSWLWGTSQLDEAIDKATSELMPAGAEDIALNLEICDQIRSKSVPAKDAMRALKRRLNHKNPNVQNLALGLTDICIKNGGDLFLTEVASREFMDNLVSILKIPVLNIDVKNNILRLVQNWSVAFEGKPALSYVGQVYKTLQTEGFRFPPKDLALANSAMVDTQTAPEWIDSDVCLRCRTPFSFTNRKHHCRNCGQVFDQQCSSKSIPLPHFGITQEVRVCDSCYPKLTKKGERSDNKGHRHSTSLHGTRHRAARELADAELQRAIQLSLQEVGAAGGHARPGYTPYQPESSSWQYTEPPLVDRSTHPKTQTSEEDDPDLRAAIEASLRESNAPRPSAPLAIETPRTEEPGFAYNRGPGYSQSYPPGVIPPQPVAKIPSYDLEPLESDAILTFSQTVEQVQGQGGRDMTRYPAVNELYDKANSLRPKLALSLDDAGRKEQMLSDMHDKLSQAVKLYDKLLTEQVVHPRWRSPQPVTNAPYQQANSSYSTGYNTANGYTQWQAPQNPVEAPSQPPQQQQYTPHAEPAQSQWFPQQQQYAEPQQQQQYAPPPPTQQYSSPAPSAPPPSQFVQSPASPSVTQPQYQPGPSHQTLPPVSYASQTPTQPSFQQQHPMGYAQSPPPPQTYASPAPAPSHIPPQSHSPTLSRHNTVTYASTSSVPIVNNAYLSRSSTISHPVTPRQQQVPQQHAPQQQQRAPPPPQQQQQAPYQPQYQQPAATAATAAAIRVLPAADAPRVPRRADVRAPVVPDVRAEHDSDDGAAAGAQGGTFD
ncbi:Vacuolar protein sorting-associated protein 27 [Mycena venus]|uniref:Vacuolar protein sorting-associated protein 27 n=1 Tax=Mycena venus TaxID=2733690 RepID=A0A8H7CLZ1_9AGAR|nr:Vacuolar protein sorting-associated protein 27 [Mycena venus]